MSAPTIPRVAALAAASLAVAGCGASDGPTGEGGTTVVASFYPMEFLAAEIGGDRVSVETLTEPGVEPHDLELTPQQVATVATADLVVYLRGLQPAVDEAVEQEGPETAVDAAEIVPFEESTETSDHEEGERDEGGGHESAEDPHIWLDPTRYAEVATAVGDGLATVDPGDAAYYQQRADDVVARLTALDREFEEGLRDCARREFVTSHAAFGYLARRYGLSQVALTGISPDAEVSPARFAEVERIAADTGATTVFFQTLASPEIAETLADDLGIDTAVLDPVESVAADSGNYFTVMRENLNALRQGLSCA